VDIDVMWSLRESGEAAIPVAKGELLMEILLIAVVIGLAPAFVAHSKGHNFFLWWLLGAALWIVFFPVSLFMRPNQAVLDQRKLTGGAMKRCHQCASVIDARARVCPQCHSDLSSAPTLLPSAGGAIAPLRYGGLPLYRVVVEWRGQSVLAALAAGRAAGGETPTVVVLRPESGNSFDKAVRVETESGELLGYLATEDALRCRADVGRLGGGIAAVRANAVVVDDLASGEASRLGVELRLTDPLMAA
jgi:hypothetical protein